MELVARAEKLLFQMIAAWVVGQGPAVGDSQKGNDERHASSASGLDARTAGHATVIDVLQVLLFASLRDRAGWSVRQMPLTARTNTAGELWAELQLGSLLAINIAVNQQLVGPERVLCNGDEVAFLPPFTGG